MDPRPVPGRRCRPARTRCRPRTPRDPRRRRCGGRRPRRGNVPAGQADRAAAQLDLVAGAITSIGDSDGEVGRVAQRPPAARRRRRPRRRCWPPGCGGGRSRQLDVEVEGEPVVDERSRDPHLQVAAGLQVGHPQVETQAAVGPADRLGPRRAGGLEAVADLEPVGGSGLEARRRAPACRLRGRRRGRGGRSPPGRGPGRRGAAFDRLAQVEGGVAGGPPAVKWMSASPLVRPATSKRSQASIESTSGATTRRPSAVAGDFFFFCHRLRREGSAGSGPATG